MSCALCLVTYFFADPVSCVYGYTWVYKLPEDYRDYLTVMYGSLTGIKGITRGKLPYLPGNFQVNTKISKVFYFYSNALPGNWKPRRQTDTKGMRRGVRTTVISETVGPGNQEGQG